MKWSTQNKINVFISLLGIFFAFFSLFFLDTDTDTDTDKVLKFAIAAIWAIIPPLYFFIEWLFLDKSKPKTEIDNFKYSQKLARDIWASILAILTLIYFK